MPESAACEEVMGAPGKRSAPSQTAFTVSAATGRTTGVTGTAGEQLLPSPSLLSATTPLPTGMSAHRRYSRFTPREGAVKVCEGMVLLSPERMPAKVVFESPAMGDHSAVPISRASKRLVKKLPLPARDERVATAPESVTKSPGNGALFVTLAAAVRSGRSGI